MNTYFVDILETAIPMSLLIGLLLIISPLIKKSFVAKWRYFMWLFVAVRLIIPLHISVFKNPITMELPQQISGMPVMTEMVNAATTTAPSISFQSILMLIWLAGMVVFTLYQIVNYNTFRKSVKRWSKPVTDENTIRIFNEIKSSLNEKRSLDFRICKSVSTPMVFGIIKPKLLLPDYDYTERELAVILRHELVHFKRNDIWYKLILVIANGINWFNPLVYVMVNAANKDIELACDAEVVKEHDMDYRRGYCEAILTVVHNKKCASTPLSTCFIISRKVIQERFKDILDLKKKRKGVGLFVIVALSVVISGGAVTFATEKAADVLEEELNIVERPTPRPKATETPVETDAPALAAQEYGRETFVDYTTYEENAAYEYITVDDTEPISKAEQPLAEGIEQEAATKKNIVDLTYQSNMIDINFGEAGEEFSSSSNFTADRGMDMVVVGNGNFKVQIVNDKTGEVVQEHDMTEGDNSVTVPVGSGEYSINAVATEDTDSRSSIYVYGK